MPPSCCAFGRVHAFIVPAVAALLASSGSARAETTDGGTGTRGEAGETIEIAGERPSGSTRAPAAASTSIEAAKFAGGIRSVAELLETAPGVTVHAAGGPGQAASLSLRGATADQSLVLLDGIPLQGPGGGAIDLTTLPAALLDRVVVSRGVLGAQLGAGALGGAVELQPRSVRERPAGGVRASLGSFGTAQVAADASGQALGWGALAGVQLDRTSGDYDYAARVPPEAPTYYGFKRENADARRASALVRLDTRPSAATELDVLLQGSAGERGLPGPATFPTPRSRALDQGGVAGLRLRGSNGELSWTARGFGRVDRLELRGVQLIADCQDGLADCPREVEHSAAARVEGEVELPLGDRQLARASVSGGEEWIGGSPTGLHRRSLASFALSDDLALPGGVALHPALRLDRAGVDSALSPGLAASFRPSATSPLELRAGLGLSFRPASFSELYLSYGGVLPNEQLAPERAFSANTGATFRRGPVTVSADAFWSSYSNLIVYELYLPARVKPFNIGGARIAGVELQAAARFPLGFDLTVAYTFLDAINGRAGFSGHHLSYRPPHRVFARLARQGDRLEGYGELSFQGRMPRNQFDTAYLPSQTLVNAGLGVRAAGPLWIDIEIKNSLDDQTLEDLFQYPLPGLSLAVLARARL